MSDLLAKTEIWNEALAMVEARLNRHIFDSWFRSIEFLGFDDEAKLVELEASDVTADWVNRYYTELLRHCLNSLGKEGYSIKWSVKPAASEGGMTMQNRKQRPKNK